MFCIFSIASNFSCLFPIEQVLPFNEVYYFPLSDVHINVVLRLDISSTPVWILNMTYIGAITHHKLHATNCNERSESTRLQLL